MDNNENKTNRFIFNNDFYENLEDASSKLPPEKDMLAPVNEIKREIKKEIPKVEEIKEEPKVNIDIPTMVDSSDTLTKKDDEPEELEVEEIKIPDPVIIEEVKEEPIINQINLDVTTGIDKALEKEVFKTTPEEEPKVDEFLYTPPVMPNQTEKVIYKAVRTPRKQTNDTEKVIPLTSVEKKVNVVSEKEEWKPPFQPQPIIIKEEINYYDEEELPVKKSNIIETLRKKEEKTGKFSILARYGDDFCAKEYITNPAINREKEIKDVILTLIMPEKSAILVGKPGIGKTSIVEGLAYDIQRNKVPDALKGYTIISVKTSSLLGTLPTGESRLQNLIDELKELDKIILFIDEVHMLIEATDESNLDFANLFKESLGRGNIKMIGATTQDEYERYILRDKAFMRRFQKVDVKEPTKEETIEIVMGTIPKIEKTTGAKLIYTHYLQAEIVKFIVEITSEYKRVYELGSRYPDICLTLLTQAFSEAVFDNRTEVNIKDVRNAILKSKSIYPDVIRKELINFDKEFKQLLDEAN